MEFAIFLAVLVVGGSVGFLGFFIGCPWLGVIAAIGCATAFIVDAIKSSGKDNQ